MTTELQRSPFPGKQLATLISAAVVAMGAPAGAEAAAPVSFEPPVATAVGTGSVFLVQGDLDGVNGTDAISINSDGTTYTVLLNGGAGALAASPSVDLGTTPNGAAIADLNGDNHPDLVIANANGTVSVLANNGSAVFSPFSGSPIDITASAGAGAEPLAVAIADFNSDNIPDLAIANNVTNNVQLLLGHDGGGGIGDGTFTTGNTIGVGVEPMSIASGNIDGDVGGHMDLAVANFSDNTVSVLLGDGTGGFSGATGSPYDVVGDPASNPFSVRLADVNSDSLLDFIITDYPAGGGATSAVEVYQQSGIDGSFASVFSATIARRPHSVAVGDLDGDGNVDLVVASDNGGNPAQERYAGLTVFLGDGAGGFATGVQYPLSGTPKSVSIVDLDGAGHADLLVTNSTENTVSTLLSTTTNAAPVALDDTLTVGEDSGDNAGTLVATDADGALLNFSIVADPTKGTVAISNAATGAYVYTPNADANGADSFTFKANDGTVDSNVATIAVTITPANDPPTIGGSPLTTVAEDTAYSFMPTANDVDVGDVLTFSITNKPTWASFDTGTGALTGTPTNADVGTTIGVVISVTDGNSAPVSLAPFNLQVTNVNDPPTIGGSPDPSVAQGGAYSFTPTANDVDVGDTLTFSITNKPGWASFDTATGALTGIPGNSDVGDYTGIVISVTDGNSAPVSLAAFDVTVTNVNDPPAISGTPPTTVAEDAAYTFTPTASDVDVGDTLTFSITNKPSWASFDTATGALTGTPTNADVGTTTGIVITATDTSLATASLPAFDLQVTNVNDVPIIGGTPTTTVAQDAPYSFTPTASDVDVGDVLTFSIANKPGWASFDTSTGALTGTPGNADVGNYAGIVISVTDGNSAPVSLAAFDLTVTNVNDAPTINGTPATGVVQGNAYSFTPTASDPDPGDTLTFSITNKPGWATFDTGTGTLSGTPGNADVGTTSGIVIAVTDGNSAPVSLASFDLTVTNSNDPPTISGSPDTTVAEGAAYSFTPTGSDPDVGDTPDLQYHQPAGLGELRYRDGYPGGDAGRGRCRHHHGHRHRSQRWHGERVAAGVLARGHGTRQQQRRHQRR